MRFSLSLFLCTISHGISEQSNSCSRFSNKYYSQEKCDVDSNLSINNEPINIGVAACGDRFNETMTMIKSVLLFNCRKINLHVFADDDLQTFFKHNLQLWQLKSRNPFSFTVYPVQYSSEVDKQEWKHLFKLCASQRLFMHDILKNVDSLIYVDTDVLFMRPVEELWNYFGKFNDSQIAGATPEHEEPQAGWYNRFAMHPYVPPYGINSGVMLMNLTRIRSIDWLKYIIPYYKEYKYKITWGDQDLINIFFHYHPQTLFQFPCSWNYRPDHCMYMSTCKDAEQHGVSVLHGNRRTFHNDQMPTFKAVYDAFNELPLGTTSFDNFKKNLIENLGQHDLTQCGKVSSIFTKSLFSYL